MTTTQQLIPQELVDTMLNDKKVRIGVTRSSHLYFFHLYFAHYVKYETAEFQKEIIALTENELVKKMFIVAFRGSGKSTIITTSYPIWAILGKLEKKFVLILCQTKTQAKQHMMNLRRELENNSLLRNDLGPFQEEDDEWGSGSLVFSKYGARITVASTEQSIRGLRHNQYRPDLIIADDVEDIASTKTREGRDKTYQWLTGEVIPAGDKNTKVVVIGNLLHEDSLLMRLKKNVEENKIDGIFKEYPLVDQNNVILWPGKYADLDAIEIEHKSVGNENSWQREYMLKIMPAEDQVVLREWINYYDVLPSKEKLSSIRIGVDLAISEKETADYTAMVIGWIYPEDNGTSRIFIDSICVNKRMDFPGTVEKCIELNLVLKNNKRPDFIIEDVAYQRSLQQLLEQKGLSARRVSIGSQDKRSRLSMTSHRIKNAEVLFPRTGCELLINQIVNFGTEKHDDLCDAFTILMLDIIDNPVFKCRPLPIQTPGKSPYRKINRDLGERDFRVTRNTIF
jgi:predicted phage terminase large subunit-like protein